MFKGAGVRISNCKMRKRRGELVKRTVVPVAQREEGKRGR